MRTGQGMFFRQIDFAEILAHLGWNVVELELRVDFFFSFARDRLLTLERGQAVFVQGVAHFQRALAQGDVVGFRSGEVLHGRAERIRRQKPHVDLHAAAQVEADLVVAAGDHVHERRVLRDVSDRLLAVFLVAAGFARDEDVEIAHGFAPAAQRSGGRDLVDAGIFLEIFGELVGFGLGGVDQEAAADAAVVFDGFDQLGFVLLAHARQFANLALAGQFLDAVDVADSGMRSR